MLSRLKLRGPLSKAPLYAKLLKRPTNSQAPKELGWFEETSTYAQKQMQLLKSTMVSQSKIVFQVPFKADKNVHTLSLSDLAGHASFMFLALSYLESDFLALRLFAVSGVSLSIIFQYYREKPLWIPIRWNTLFLVINAVMIVALLKEERDAQNIPSEKKHLYESTFAKKGMKPVDFLHLCSAAERLEVKKGDVIVSEKLKNTRVYLVKSGQLTVHQNGTLVRTIQADQFVGSMSFLSWEDKIDAAKLQRKRQKDSLKNWSNKNSDTELFLPILILIENLLERLNLRRHHHEQQCTTPHETQAAQEACPAKHSHDGHDHSHDEASSAAGWVAALFEEIPASELQDEDAAYGITVDENGNVIAREPEHHHHYRHHDAEEPHSTVGQYLAASYSFLSSMVAPISSANEDTVAANAAPNQTTPGDVGMLGYADVVAESDCILYFWSFQSLRALIELYPSLGLAFERALSEDINKKMSRSMQSEPLQRYQLMLSGAVSGGETSDLSKKILADFRAKHSISQKDHTALLEEFGWSTHDFSSGFKGAPALSIQQQYLALLNTALSNTHDEPLTDEQRTELRVFRLRNNINSSGHMAALKQLAWTVDEYEIGSQNPDHASAKETRAIVANQYAQRRGRIRATIMSYVNVFPSVSSILPSSLFPETAAAAAPLEDKKEAGNV